MAEGHAPTQGRRVADLTPGFLGGHGFGMAADQGVSREAGLAEQDVQKHGGALCHGQASLRHPADTHFDARFGQGWREAGFAP